MNITRKIISAILLLIVAGALIAITMMIGVIIFSQTIDANYAQYPIVSQGVMTNEIDCLGFGVVSIGQYAMSNQIHMYSIADKSNDIRYTLKGGDCEYTLYKGWNWGIWDFYYITPK
jgi:hypothetical protein